MIVSSTLASVLVTRAPSLPQSAIVTGTQEAERDRARAAFSANLAVLPGLGSLLAGRREGWLQAPLALAGLTLSVRWLALVLADW